MSLDKLEPISRKPEPTCGDVLKTIFAGSSFGGVPEGELWCELPPDHKGPHASGITRWRGTLVIEGKP
jgi:hypothetical protein